MVMRLTLVTLLLFVRCVPAPHHTCVIDVRKEAAHGVVELTDDSCVYLLKYIEYSASESFQVRACHDFEIIITEHSSIDHIDQSLLLGGYGNKETCFARHGKCDHHDKTYYGPVLSCHEYKSFWLTFDHHYITLGWGLYPKSHSWLVYEHGPPHTKYLAARLGIGTRASMAFDPTFIQTTQSQTLPPPTTSITTLISTQHTKRPLTTRASSTRALTTRASTTRASSTATHNQYTTTWKPSSTSVPMTKSRTSTSTTPTKSSTTRLTTSVKAIDGQWGSWWTVTPCSKSCGGGTQVRQRLCDKPRPLNGGKNCTGIHEMSEACNTQSCPVNGNWGAWRDVLACSASCGGGTVVRARLCNSPAPSNGGKNCAGSNHLVGSCNSFLCTTALTTAAPVDGQWGAWRTLVQCSVSCGGGIEVRARLCNSPTPSHGGKSCAGESHSTSRCNTHSCPTTTTTSPTTPTTTTTTTTTSITSSTSTMIPTTLPLPTSTVGSYIASPFDSLKNSTVCKDMSQDCNNQAALVAICSTPNFAVFCKKSCGHCH